MKKIYVKPQTEVVIMDALTPLLAGSPLGGAVIDDPAEGGKDVLAPPAIDDFNPLQDAELPEVPFI